MISDQTPVPLPHLKLTHNGKKGITNFQYNINTGGKLFIKSDTIIEFFQEDTLNIAQLQNRVIAPTQKIDVAELKTSENNHNNITGIFGTRKRHIYIKPYNYRCNCQ